MVNLGIWFFKSICRFIFDFVMVVKRIIFLLELFRFMVKARVVDKRKELGLELDAGIIVRNEECWRGVEVYRFRSLSFYYW